MMVPECCFWYDERMWDDAPSDTWNAIIGEKYDVKAWPIRDLLGMNLGSILHSAQYAKWKNMWYR
jgi:hypothetical protein